MISLFFFQVNAQRIVDDIQGRHQHELNSLQGRLQVQADQHNNALAQFQAQAQLQMGQIQTLQATVEQLNAEKQSLLLAAAAAGQQQQQQVEPQVSLTNA